MDDAELLRAYAQEGSEEAFKALTERYLGLVYSAALRQTGQPEQARDVAQAVFLLLARKAKSLPARTILSGWLYRTARFVALESVRSEARRKRREEEAGRMSVEENAGSKEDMWKQLSPYLDGAMARLSETDRCAVLLRFFQGRSLKELGEALEISEEAAKKRVSRALEKLRGILAHQGVSSSSSMLGAALAAYAVQASPSSAAAVAAGVLGKGAVGSAEILSKGALHMIAWTKAKMAAACVVAVALTTATVKVSVDHAKVAREHDRLRQQATRVSAASNESEANSKLEIEAMRAENRRLKERMGEVSKLRNNVAQLQSERETAAVPAMTLNLAKAPPKYRKAAETLRELQYEQFIQLGQKAMTLKPLSEEERNEYAWHVNFSKQLGLAMRVYATEHGDEFPASFDDLLATDLLTPEMKEEMRNGRYEYTRFENAEKKPQLPAAWWRGPDERGVRVLVLNDGSAHVIREPTDAGTPGILAAGEGRKQ